MRAFLILIVVGVCGCATTRSYPKVQLSEWGKGHSRATGNVYYHAFMQTTETNGFVVLDIINNTGHRIALRKGDLATFDLRWDDPEGPGFFYSGEHPGSVMKGPDDYVVVPFDVHSDGNYCGWSIARVTRPIPRNPFDSSRSILDDLPGITIDTRVLSYISDMRRPVWLLVRATILKDSANKSVEPTRALSGASGSP